MKTILIVEDDPAVAKGLKEVLTQANHTVEVEMDGAKGFRKAKQERIALIILDVILPNMDGKEICSRLRADGVDTPILMLTQKKSEADKVSGLEIGADDYVTKPFSMPELLARVKALLRRGATKIPEMAETTFGDVYIDFTAQEATKGKKKIRLSAKEFHLLKYFVTHEGDVLSRAQLLDHVWGYEVTPTTRTVDNYVLSLRKKLESDPSKPKHFLTIHTAGYKFAK